MAGTRIVALPLELLQRIATYISNTHRPSLYAFSLTSHACYSASTFLIFRHIGIVVYNPEILRREVANLCKALSRANSARHVRCITVRGALYSKAPKPIWVNSWLNWWRMAGLDEILLDEELTGYTNKYVVYDEGVIEKGGEDDMAWTSFVNLVVSIPHLADLVYDCRSQFPPSLLRALHEQQPQCRLHHLTFRFRTLLWGTPYPYEMELATSPSLHRVKICCSSRDSDGDDDFNQEAMQELVASLAPNLREIVALQLYPCCSGRYIRRRGSWHGLPDFTGEKRGTLTTLAIKGHTRLVEPELLQSWYRHTDFACLQNLALEGCYDSKYSVISGETMNWVAQNCSFPQLRALSVYLTRDDLFLERPHYSETAASFFWTLESLKELSIVGPLDSNIVGAVLSHHGQTLRKLKLEPQETPYHFSNGRHPRDIPFEFTEEHIRQIQAQCPVLEELAIPVKRSMSNASEAQLYRCFGNMKRLQTLFLTLDCSNWSAKRDDAYSPQFDGEDDEPVKEFDSLKRGIVKETLINCAVDEALARSVWQVITQDMTGRRLERLKLWTTGGGHYGGPFGPLRDEIIDDLSRSWLIERPVRDDDDEIIIKELGKQAREVRDRRNWHQKDSFLRVFRSIWPCADDSRSWRGNWTSFPLQI